MGEDIVVDAVNDPLLEKEAEEVLEQDKVWEDIVGKEWPQWPDDQRNLHTSGAKCSLLGRSVGDMTEAELIMFIGFLDQLCSQQNSALHWYAKQEEERLFKEQQAAKARDEEIKDGHKTEDAEGPDPEVDLVGHTD